MIEVADDGARASMPGQIDIAGHDGYADFPSLDALPVLGRERRIARGLLQSPADYAGELRRHLDYARRAGTAFVVLDRIASLLSPAPPMLRLVTNTTAATTWYTRLATGDFIVQNTLGMGLAIAAATGAVSPNTSIAKPWDWDSHSNPAPPDAGEPGRIWIIVYAPCNGKYLAGDEGQWGDGTTKYGDGDGTTEVKTIGTTTTEQWVQLIRGEAKTWRCAGHRLSHIIVAFDPASFNPLSSTGLPDGHWGNHGRILFGARVRARLASARYFRGIAGNSY